MRYRRISRALTLCAVVAIMSNITVPVFAQNELGGVSNTQTETEEKAVQSAIVTGKVTDEQGNPMVGKINIRKKTPGLFDILCTTTTYSDASGNFKLNIKPGTYIVTIDKGSEFELYTKEIQAVDKGNVTVNARMKRIIDLTSLGWYGGDQHQHSSEDTKEGLSTPREIAQGNIAYGLSWSALTEHSNRDENNTEGFWNGYKKNWEATAGLDTNIGTNFLPIVGSEVSATSNGHFNRLGGKHERIEQYAGDEQGVMRIGNDIKNLGGVSIINHPNNEFDQNIKFKYWDNEEVVNTFDGVEVWNGSFPIGIDGFLNNESFTSWYEHLSKGNKLAAVAGTDAHDLFADSIPHITEEDLKENKEVLEAYENIKSRGSKISLNELVKKLKEWLNYGFAHGSVRTYVQADEFNEENILTGIRNGNTFVTNGPVILAEVDGAIPGNTVKGKANNELQVRLTSNNPLTEAVVIVDGKPYETIVLDNVTDTTLNLTLDLSDAKWVAVYAKGKYPAFAHTSSIYVSHSVDIEDINYVQADNFTATQGEVEKIEEYGQEVYKLYNEETVYVYDGDKLLFKQAGELKNLINVDGNAVALVETEKDDKFYTDSSIEDEKTLEVGIMKDAQFIDVNQFTAKQNGNNIDVLQYGEKIFKVNGSETNGTLKGMFVIENKAYIVVQNKKNGTIIVKNNNGKPAKVATMK